MIFSLASSFVHGIQGRSFASQAAANQIDITGELFLYPRPVIWMPAFGTPEANDYQWERDTGVFPHLFVDANDPYAQEVPVVQIWALNADNNNWKDHDYLSKLRKQASEDCFPTYLPLSLFLRTDESNTHKVIEEGESIELSNENYFCRVTCHQQGKKYGPGLTFQAMLRDCVFASHERLEQKARLNQLAYPRESKQWQQIEEIKQSWFPTNT